LNHAEKYCKNAFLKVRNVGYNVACQLKMVRRLKTPATRPSHRVDSSYSCLQEFLPNVAKSTVTNPWTGGEGKSKGQPYRKFKT